MAISLQAEAIELARNAQDLLHSQYEAKAGNNNNQSTTTVILAHYTSLDALISMLQSGDGGLRLSDSTTMNDPNEGRTTSDGREFLRKLEKEFGTDSWPWRRYSAAHLCCFVGVKRESNGDPTKRVVDAGDDLLFWRLYGNECRGVSITVAAHESKRLIEKFAIQEVVYAEDAQLGVELDGTVVLLHKLNDLRERALKAGEWTDRSSELMPSCDRVFAQRFLHKHLHYEMESEYRAVAFLTTDENGSTENVEFTSRGKHVQYGLVRNFVQISDLRCNSILTTNSQITIGSKVPERKDAANEIRSLLKDLGKAPNVVSVRESLIPYRPR